MSWSESGLFLSSLAIRFWIIALVLSMVILAPSWVVMPRERRVESLMVPIGVLIYFSAIVRLTVDSLNPTSFAISLIFRGRRAMAPFLK